MGRAASLLIPAKLRMFSRRAKKPLLISCADRSTDKHFWLRPGWSWAVPIWGRRSWQWYSAGTLSLANACGNLRSCLISSHQLLFGRVYFTLRKDHNEWRSLWFGRNEEIWTNFLVSIQTDPKERPVRRPSSKHQIENQRIAEKQTLDGGRVYHFIRGTRTSQTDFKKMILAHHQYS